MAERLAWNVSLCAHLWEYRGPQEKLTGIEWGADEAVADAVRHVLGEGQGKITELRGNVFVSQFENPFTALTAAKSLQIKLLTLHRNPPGSQLVAAVMILGQPAEAASKVPDSSSVALAEANSAQILVGATIYEAAKTVIGFQFGPKPVREAGEDGRSEALYELLWTDESTYSHVRKTGQAAAPASSGTKRYEIQSELGRGAMGVVYKAIDKVIGRTVALKTISIQHNFADQSELVERLKLEAKAAGSLDHPNIITIYDVGQDDEVVYLSMQFVEGKTLASLLNEGKLPPISTLLSYVDQILSAVGFAHQRGVIHRDLKPANFMVTADGTVKVLDFGIAKLADTSVTQTGMIMGTPTYMAPEQATGKKLDQRSDIFSLGTIFYELFTLEKPFKGDIAAVLYKLIHEDPTPPSIINPGLPAGIDRIISKALKKNSKERYQSCEEMREAFREQAGLLQSSALQTMALKPVEATASTPPTTKQLRVARARSRRSGSSVGTSAFLVILAAAALTAAWSIRVKSRTGEFPTRVQRIISAAETAKERASSARRLTEIGPVSPEQTATDTSATSVNVTAVPATPDAQPAPNTAAVAPAASPAPSTAQLPTPAPDTAKTEPSAQLTQPLAQTNSDAVATSAGKTTKEDATEANASAFTAPSQAQGDDDQPSSTAKPAQTVSRRASKPTEDNVRVEGFSRADIPDLLSKADVAAGAGDYTLALYEYNLVLKLDHRNPAARSGVVRVTAAKQEKLR